MRDITIFVLLSGPVQKVRFENALHEILSLDNDLHQKIGSEFRERKDGLIEASYSIKTSKPKSVLQDMLGGIGTENLEIIEGTVELAAE